MLALAHKAASHHDMHMHMHAHMLSVSHDMHMRTCTCRTLPGRRSIGWSTSLRVTVHSRVMGAIRASLTLLHTGMACLTT